MFTTTNMPLRCFITEYGGMNLFKQSTLSIELVNRSIETTINSISAPL